MTDTLNEKQAAEFLLTTWQGKVLDHLHWRQLPWGTILMSALRPHAPVAPRFGSATVDKNGRMYATLTNIDGTMQFKKFLCTTEQFQGDFRRIADDCKLTDTERTEMFAVLKSWISKDERVETQL